MRLPLLLNSLGYAQLERFEEEDLGKYAFIARVATDFNEFGLSAKQYDRLREADILSFGRQRYSLDIEARTKVDREFLRTVYEVLDDKQAHRLDQIIFQRWMNRDNIGTALLAFAPGEVKGMDSKLGELQKRVDRQLTEALDSLPNEPRSRFRPTITQPQSLVEFLAWRWREQTVFLTEELGEERVQQLIGKPVTLAYQFRDGR